MTTTPPEAPSEPTPDSEGPRVSASAQARDLSALRRTTGGWRRLGGVAGGLARHFDVDPILLRVGFVVLTLFGGAGLVLYVGCWLLLPEDGAPAATLNVDARTREVALLVLAVLGALMVVGGTFGDGLGWLLAIIAGVVGIVLLLRRDRPRAPGTAAAHGATGWQAIPEDTSTAAAPPAHHPAGQPVGQPAWPSGQPGYQTVPPRPVTPPRPDPRKRGPVLFWGTSAIIVLACGLLGIVDVAGADVPGAAYPALALALTGAGLVLSSVWGRGGGLVALGLVASLALAATLAVGSVESESETITPTTSVADRYGFGAGDKTLDLSQMDPALLDERNLMVEGGVGRLRVIVPEDLDVAVTADVGLGDINMFGEHQEGPGSTATMNSPGLGGAPGKPLPQLELRTQLGLGSIEIVREGEQ